MISNRIDRAKHSPKKLALFAKNAATNARAGAALLLEGEEFKFEGTIDSLTYANECLEGLTVASATCTEDEAKAHQATKKAVDSLLIYFHFQAIQKNVQIKMHAATHGSLEGLTQQIGTILPESELNALLANTIAFVNEHITSDEPLQPDLILKCIYRELTIGNLATQFDKAMDSYRSTNDISAKLAELVKAKELVIQRLANANDLLAQPSLQQKLKEMIATLIAEFTQQLTHQATVAATIEVYEHGLALPLQDLATLKLTMSTAIKNHVEHIWQDVVKNGRLVTLEELNECQEQWKVCEPYLNSQDHAAYDKVNTERLRLKLKLDANLLDEVREVDAPESAQEITAAYETYLAVSERALEMVKKHLPEEIYNEDLMTHVIKSNEYISHLHKSATNAASSDRGRAISLAEVARKHANASKLKMISMIRAELKLDNDKTDLNRRLAELTDARQIARLLPCIYKFAFDCFEIAPTLSENDSMRNMDHVVEFANIFLKLTDNAAFAEKYAEVRTNISNLRKMIIENPPSVMRLRTVQKGYTKALHDNNAQAIIQQGGLYANALEAHRLGDHETIIKLHEIYRQIGLAYHKTSNWTGATRYLNKAIMTGIATIETYNELINVLEETYKSCRLPEYLRRDCKNQLEQAKTLRNNLALSKIAATSSSSGVAAVTATVPASENSAKNARGSIYLRDLFTSMAKGETAPFNAYEVFSTTMGDKPFYATLWLAFVTAHTDEELAQFDPMVLDKLADGLMHERTRGLYTLPANINRAELIERLLKIAASKNLLDAYGHLGIFYEKHDVEKSVFNFLKAIELGWAHARVKLVKLYMQQCNYAAATYQCTQIIESVTSSPQDKEAAKYYLAQIGHYSKLATPIPSTPAEVRNIVRTKPLAFIDLDGTIFFTSGTDRSFYGADIEHPTRPTADMLNNLHRYIIGGVDAWHTNFNKILTEFDIVFVTARTPDDPNRPCPLIQYLRATYPQIARSKFIFTGTLDEENKAVANDKYPYMLEECRLAGYNQSNGLLNNCFLIDDRHENTARAISAGLSAIYVGGMAENPGDYFKLFQENLIKMVDSIANRLKNLNADRHLNSPVYSDSDDNGPAKLGDLIEIDAAVIKAGQGKQSSQSNAATNSTATIATSLTATNSSSTATTRSAAAPTRVSADSHAKRPFVADSRSPQQPYKHVQFGTGQRLAYREPLSPPVDPRRPPTPAYRSTNSSYDPRWYQDNNGRTNSSDRNRSRDRSRSPNSR